MKIKHTVDPDTGYHQLATSDGVHLSKQTPYREIAVLNVPTDEGTRQFIAFTEFWAGTDFRPYQAYELVSVETQSMGEELLEDKDGYFD